MYLIPSLIKEIPGEVFVGRIWLKSLTKDKLDIYGIGNPVGRSG